MAKILICFASTTGNTEQIADLLQSYLEEEGHLVFIEDVMEIDPTYISGYDATFIGTYTWDDGDLPFEIEDFYEELEEEDLTGIPVGVFGSGDTSYNHFCGAVDTIQERVRQCGATLIADGLKIEMNPSDEEDESKCRSFAQKLTNHLSEISV
ncbi:flavodoxin [Halobacillus yeomjeoni]|uniref:Flavodoxin n=1 Tax=Halobacillus yeomjeoni TaxID=311194 RepID=A0A931HWP4_9BACI|nr:flavodoxin [Halobacillus yeomjeoni]MBH0230989.1 flavodoxin [Halobacillus yeomjeoni]MCA0984570.1 flavodoxin [Halobacillus yeomjeoni]